jgi:hypothetical protein
MGFQAEHMVRNFSKVINVTNTNEMLKENIFNS